MGAQFFFHFGNSTGEFTSIVNVAAANGRFTPVGGSRIVSTASSLSLADQIAAFVNCGGMTAVDAARMLGNAKLS